MTKNLTGYVSDLLPDHDVLEMRVAHRGLSHCTVVARFDDVEDGTVAVQGDGPPRIDSAYLA